MGCGLSTSAPPSKEDECLAQVPEDTPLRAPSPGVLPEELESFNRDELIVPRIVDQSMQIAPYAELAPLIKQGQLLGEGGFGFVCQVKWKGKEIAVKQLKDSKKNNVVGDFIREVIALSTVTHPAIVRLNGVSCDGENRLLLYELMAGGSLSDRLFLSQLCTGYPEEVVEFGWDECLVAVIDSCLGLACLHECTLLHCDIKTENILIRTNGRAAVADFGLSRSEQGAEERGGMGFTRGYQDPYWKVKKKYTFASDVYAMGMVLFQAVSIDKVMDLQLQRKLVDDEEDFISYIKKSPRYETNWPEDVSDGLSRLGFRCTMPKPDDRPSIRHMLDAFTEISKLEGCYGRCPQLDEIRCDSCLAHETQSNIKEWGANIRHSLEEIERSRRALEKANQDNEKKKRKKEMYSAPGSLPGQTEPESPRGTEKEVEVKEEEVALVEPASVIPQSTRDDADKLRLAKIRNTCHERTSPPTLERSDTNETC